MGYVVKNMVWAKFSSDVCFRQLLDVLNAHFQEIFDIGKTKSTLLQLAYFVSTLSIPTWLRIDLSLEQGAYLVYAPIASVFVSLALSKR